MPANFYGVKVRKNMRLKYKIDFLSYLWGSKNLICVKKKIFILDPMFLYNFFLLNKTFKMSYYTSV